MYTKKVLYEVALPLGSLGAIYDCTLEKLRYGNSLYWSVMAADEHIRRQESWIGTIQAVDGVVKFTEEYNNVFYSDEDRESICEFLNKHGLPK